MQEEFLQNEMCIDMQYGISLLKFRNLNDMKDMCYFVLFVKVSEYFWDILYLEQSQGGDMES